MKGRTIAEVLAWLDPRMSAFERDRVLKAEQNKFIEKANVSPRLFDMASEARRKKRVK